MSVLSAIWSALSYLAPFVFVLSIVVFFHELGHFLVGRWCGVKVDAFSLGFGPELFAFTDRKGTRWRLAALPLGGYVKFKGDLNGASVPDNELIDSFSEEERRQAFQFKPVWQRAAIVAAGPIFNFILALAIFVGTLVFVGRLEVAPVVENVVAGSPAEAAGIKPGDRILMIDGAKVDTFDDIRSVVSGLDHDLVKVEIEREGRILTLDVQSRVVEQRTNLGVFRSRVLGVSSSGQEGHRKHVKYGLGDAVVIGAGQVVGVVNQSVRFLSGLVAGRESADQLSGPIRIAQVSGKVAEHGLLSLLTLAAIISISIGFINLMPIPMLDGGHLVFYAAEALRGRPLSERAQDIGFRIGLAIVLALMIVSTWNDIAHFASL